MSTLLSLSTHRLWVCGGECVSFDVDELCSWNIELVVEEMKIWRRFHSDRERALKRPDGCQRDEGRT